MKIVFLLEEESMRNALQGVLPRLLPEDVQFQLVPHEGKGDLERSLPIKLRNWREPEVRFVVVRDQDKNPDCKAVKVSLLEMCRAAGRPDTLVRIVCHSLEAWFLADLAAVEAGLGLTRLAKHQARADCRAPDSVAAPYDVLKILAPTYQKLAGSAAIGPNLDLNNERSPSFRALVNGVRRLAIH